MRRSKRIRCGSASGTDRFFDEVLTVSVEVREAKYEPHLLPRWPQLKVELARRRVLSRGELYRIEVELKTTGRAEAVTHAKLGSMILAVTTATR